jgi:predicted membrane GTPase involved in stress response
MAIAYIREDELVEVTPLPIRLGKRRLDPSRVISDSICLPASLGAPSQR